MRQTKERILKMLIDESCERKMESRNKKINKKYKMVKFFGTPGLPKDVLRERYYHCRKEKSNS